jgi:hypothetical protein
MLLYSFQYQPISALSGVFLLSVFQFYPASPFPALRLGHRLF